MLHKHLMDESPWHVTVHYPAHDFTFEIYGEAPVQAFGEIGGREFYFRARHFRWSCEVADHRGALPSDGQAAADGFLREGKHPNASFMSLREALKIIERCMREYVGIKSR